MIIGITGGFGCGKSTCLKIFETLNFQTISADQICHNLYSEKNIELHQPLQNRWGDNILLNSGELDRKQIAEIVFANKNELDFLTSVINPLIDKKIIAIIEDFRTKNISLIIEIPLLFEANYNSLVDKTLVVFSSLNNRIENLKKRDFNLNDIELRDKMQMPLEQKIELANFCIINSGSLEILELQIKRIINFLNI